MPPLTNQIAIVIVNYRTASLTTDSLGSISEQSTGEHRVCVVDNDSQDGSPEAIAAAAELHGWCRTHLIPAERNGGFAYGNNIGLRALLEEQAETRKQKAEMAAAATASSSTPHPPITPSPHRVGELSPSLPQYILLLNPDTLVRPGAIETMTRFLDEHPAVGIVGPRLLDADGRPQCSAHRFPSPLGELEGALRLGLASRLLARWRVSPPITDTPHACDWVSGAAMLIRREVFEQIGLLDEGFFLYFEEVDFCKRARSAGWEVWYEPAAQIVHLEGASTGIREPRKRRASYWYDSRRRYFRKHHGLLGLIAADLLWSIGRAAFGIRKALGLARGGVNSPPFFAWDLLWGDLRSLTRDQVGTDLTIATMKPITREEALGKIV